jgi:Tfp pilus assembly protein PilN
VKAVNLIPADQRRGAGGVGGRASGAAHVLVAALAVFVILGVVYAVSARQAADRRSKLSHVTVQANAAQAQAAALQPYVEFASLRAQRQQAIGALAAGRFNFSGAMDQIARALPSDVTLSALTSSPAAAGSGPAFAMAGCARTHPEVARVLVLLHKIQGVTRVSLASSQKGGGQGASSSCSGAAFNATVAYGGSGTALATSAPAAASNAAPATPAPAPAAAPAAPATPQAAPAATTGSNPAATPAGATTTGTIR